MGDAGRGATGGALLEEQDTVESRERIWTTVVWNDPVNLMGYVARVFRTYFGYPPAEAERLMMLVHTDGRAVVASGPRELMERHVQAMHEYGLLSTLGTADA